MQSIAVERRHSIFQILIKCKQDIFNLAFFVMLFAHLHYPHTPTFNIKIELRSLLTLQHIAGLLNFA
jgi:hypothetical protein